MSQESADETESVRHDFVLFSGTGYRIDTFTAFPGACFNYIRYSIEGNGYGAPAIATGCPVRRSDGFYPFARLEGFSQSVQPGLQKR